MSDYIIQKLEPEHFDLILPLMKDCFGMDVDVNYFKWKFLENPAGHFVGFIAVEPKTNEVAAYYGAIPEVYCINGEKKTIYQSCDTMTHSKHRRKGLFKDLAQHCYDYFRERDELFIIGLSGPQSTPGFLKFGWRKIFDFENLFVPRFACYTALLRPYPDTSYEQITDFSLIENLIPREESTSVYSFRDLNHFIWRLGNPQRSLKTIAFRQNGIYEGYVVFHLQDGKLFLFDHVFRNKKSRKALINYLKRQVLDKKFAGIIALCQENNYINKDLRRSGFLANPFKNKGPLHQRTPFIFYSDDKVMDQYNDPSSWLVTSYDHDAS